MDEDRELQAVVEEIQPDVRSLENDGWQVRVWRNEETHIMISMSHPLSPGLNFSVLPDVQRPIAEQFHDLLSKYSDIDVVKGAPNVAEPTATIMRSLRYIHSWAPETPENVVPAIAALLTETGVLTDEQMQWLEQLL